MTTPNSNTPMGVITDALTDAGKLQQGQDPSGEQIAGAMRRLIDQINYFGTKGLKLWVNEDITVPIVSGQAAYTFAPAGTVDMTKPLRVLEAQYRYDTGGTRRPLTVMSLRDYWTLGQGGTSTSAQGTISQYLVEKQQLQLKVTFWQCPNQEEEDNGEVHLLMQTQLTNPTNLVETMNFPIEWRLPLRWCLANDLCTGQPPDIVAKCEKWATFYRTELENWDVEDAPTSFAPDSRMNQGYGNFR